MSAVPRGPLRIVVLISGRGSNMLAIAQAARTGRLNATVAAVLSDQAQAAGLGSAAALGIACEAIPVPAAATRTEYDRLLARAVRAQQPDVVALAGFMRILSTEFVAEFTGRLLNIHPSLLPKYRGLRTHERALAAGDTDHGCSVHFVTDELDGGPLLVQARVAVEPGDSVATLSARVQAQEHRIYPMTLELIASGRLQWRDGAPWLDGRRLDAPIVVDDAAPLPRAAS